MEKQIINAHECPVDHWKSIGGLVWGMLKMLVIEGYQTAKPSLVCTSNEVKSNE